MIFNEIYSAYYNTVAKIITRILSEKAQEKELLKIVSDTAFGESMLNIMPSLKSEKWQLVRRDMTTPIQHKPSMPLTEIQKRWLKSISLDPRIKLFDFDLGSLDGVEPLFTANDYVIYDKYSDGDPYEDEGYIERFRTALSALKENKPLKISTFNRSGRLITFTAMPLRLEYSEKDDKFRLINSRSKFGATVNMARIVSIEKCSADSLEVTAPIQSVKKTVTLKISDERNALERCLLHFAHFEKQAERLDKNTYLVHIKYDRDDETEMVIRTLSFGPMVEVTEPDGFRKLITERLKRQLSCELR